METVEWVSIPGATVKLARFAAGGRAVVIHGVDFMSEEARCAELEGFQPGEIDGDPALIRQGATFKLSEMRRIFQTVRVVKRSFSDTRRDFSSRYEEKISTSSHQEASTPAEPSSPTVTSMQAKESTSDVDVSEVEKERDLSANRLGIGERVNKFQNRYMPKSRLGNPVAMVPSNMALAVSTALENVEKKYGDIDEFVATRLGFRHDELESYLSPEQIDAIALSIKASEDGRGAIVADQTGLGKGRILAGLARAAAEAGKKVVFITEKANLFTDFWRDVTDIGSQDVFGEPFLLNDGSQISDPETAQPIYKAPKKKHADEVIASGALPEDCGLVMATYSQFNRKGSKKSDFLNAIAAGAVVICDESHNAVGDSNTSHSIGAALEASDSAVFSSATFASRAASMAAYAKVFPPGFMDPDKLAEVLTAGGPALLEVLSQTLAEDGVLIRREHDLSGIDIEIVEDTSRRSRNIALADQLSPILRAMAKMSLRINDIVEERNEENKQVLDAIPKSKRKHARETWNVGNFGSRLGACIRQFVTALEVDSTVDQCISSLESGVKPVVVVESTMESLMRELSGGNVRSGSKAQDDLFVTDEETGEKRPPDFRAALRMMLDRMMTLSVRRGADRTREEVPVEDIELLAEADRIRTLIAEFPDLSMSPIDDIRERIEAAGYAADEISARGMRIRDGQYESMPNRDRNKIIADFNSGETDAIILTRAGSTGLSLHASEKVKDQRPRRMIELQIPNNVVERVQFWGRVNRRGQVCLPTFCTMSTGLPFQVRMLSAQNKKVEELSATVTASTDSATMLDVPDLLNSVGNDVARRLLSDRPRIAEDMGIWMEVNRESADEELYFINKLLQRLVLLPSEQQEKVYGALLNAYADAEKEMAAKGSSPHGGRELEGTWRVVSSKVFEDAPVEGDTAFSRPVSLTRIATEREATPLQSDGVDELIRAARERLVAEFGEEASPQAPLKSHIGFLSSHREQILKGALSKKFDTIEKALAAKQDNAVKSADRRLREMSSLLKYLRPGIPVSGPDSDGGQAHGFVVDVRAPKLEEAHFPGRYSIRYVYPGDEEPREISLAGVMRDSKSFLFYDVEPKGVSSFGSMDSAPRGQVTVERDVLDGNLFGAVSFAHEQGFGSATSFMDEDGSTHRAVVIPKSKSRTLRTIPGQTNDVDALFELLREGRGPIFTNPSKRSNGVIIKAENNKAVMHVPGNQTALKRYGAPDIREITGKLYQVRFWREAEFAPNKVPQLLELLISKGNLFYYEGKHRPAVQNFKENGRMEEPRDSQDSIQEQNPLAKSSSVTDMVQQVKNSPFAI